jgi:hypothetical protein
VVDRKEGEGDEGEGDEGEVEEGQQCMGKRVRNLSTVGASFSFRIFLSVRS